MVRLDLSMSNFMFKNIYINVYESYFSNMPYALDVNGFISDFAESICQN